MAGRARAPAGGVGEWRAAAPVVLVRLPDGQEVHAAVLRRRRDPAGGWAYLLELPLWARAELGGGRGSSSVRGRSPRHRGSRTQGPEVGVWRRYARGGREAPGVRPETGTRPRRVCQGGPMDSTVTLYGGPLDGERLDLYDPGDDSVRRWGGDVP
ncbi:hypothetical protein D7294_17190 [Streptomyces hoynatensis]|uniref:Uncharacterized protein n=1 Tax=Streptomyces hoynatensis TaxID=1141874 RepID=A0A3A9YXQ0_9ACTN|nr:hypothetical protein D7294_17190 [Streptomyces hoynatensis]